MTESERITRALQGHWYGHYGLAFCPAHENTRTPALSLTEGHGGRLLAHCHAGCAFPAILNALRGLGVIEGCQIYAPTAAADLTHNHAAEEAEAIRREGQALSIWREALPIHDTIAETYLREVRGITCPLPAKLRFHPSAWHGPSAKRMPAMVALVEGCKRVAIHRTYLRPDGHGKAMVAPDKMMLGATAGGAVSVSGAPAGPLVVAEGIETALSLASGLLRIPATVWAALSTSGIRRLSLPIEAGRLTIAADGDEPGRTAANALAERASSLGWQVSLLPAPDDRDWNDILNAKGNVA